MGTSGSLVRDKVLFTLSGRLAGHLGLYVINTLSVVDPVQRLSMFERQNTVGKLRGILMKPLWLTITRVMACILYSPMAEPIFRLFSLVERHTLYDENGSEIQVFDPKLGDLQKKYSDYSRFLKMLTLGIDKVTVLIQSY